MSSPNHPEILLGLGRVTYCVIRAGPGAIRLHAITSRLHAVPARTPWVWCMAFRWSGALELTIWGRRGHFPRAEVDEPWISRRSVGWHAQERDRPSSEPPRTTRRVRLRYARPPDANSRGAPPASGTASASCRADGLSLERWPCLRGCLHLAGSVCGKYALLACAHCHVSDKP